MAAKRAASPSADATVRAAKRTKKEIFAAPHGNYKNYYVTHMPNDDRASLLPADVLAGKVCLDIGCNAGLLTLQLARQHAPAFIRGVDIDRTLISKAKRNWRREAQAALRSVAVASGQGFVACAALSESLDARLASVLARYPISLAYEEGPLDHRFDTAADANQEPVRARDPVPVFPFNVAFGTADVLCLEAGAYAGRYEVISCFSVTKWIHLNGGDEALLRLFRLVFALLPVGGVFVVEPQPWSSYRPAKMTREQAATFASLQLRPADFGDILVSQIGFSSVRTCEREPKPGVPASMTSRPVLLCFK